MRKCLARVAKVAGLGLLLVVVVMGAAWLYWGYSAVPDAPALSAEALTATLLWDNREREYVEFIPANLPGKAPLIIVLHGSVMNGGMMRIGSGFEFDRLADEKGFAVVYPDGIMGHWNDCRNKATFAAKHDNVDDVGFLLALVERMEQEHGIDPSRVFLVGYSNGGHMAFRVGIEVPHRIAGIAVAGASLPVAADSDCSTTGATPPVMQVSGTGDNWNPYDGGEAGNGRYARRGHVMSALDSAIAFARRNGITTDAIIEPLPDQARWDGTWVTRYSFLRDGKPFVVLYGITNGGHVFPQPVYRFPRMYGTTTDELHMPEVAVEFFGL